jgi:hypothetical protein
MPITPNRSGHYDYPFTKVVTGDTTYFTAHIFEFQGTDLVGSPYQAVIVGGIVDSTTQDIRIYDFTNAKVICEVTGISTSFPSMVDLGTLSNLSTGPAIWEIQMKRPSGGPAREVAVASLYLRF